jgi:hypothetical protein
MKIKILAATLLIASGMFFASCGNNTSESKNETSTTEQATNVKYHCPMRCEGDKMYDKPGQCPVCNMNLEKMDSTTHEHQGHEQNH